MIRGFKYSLFALGMLLAFGANSGAQAQGAFGAFAVAPDGSWGYSSSFATVDIAQDRALAECAKYGKGCQILRVFENVCVSVARNEDPKNVVVNWVSGYDAQERPRRALRNCRNDGGDQCKILIEFCSGNAK